MGVEVDRQIGFLTQCFKQYARCRRLQQTRHILQRDDMRASFFNLLGQIDIIFKIVFGAIRIENITRIANGRFTKLVLFQHGIHRHAHVLNPVEAVEHAEQVHAAARCFTHEILHQIVRVGLVANAIRATQQHLEQNVRGAFAHHCQTFPWVFRQEAHRYVKGRTAPALKRKQVRQCLRIGIGHARNIIGTHTGCQQ